MQGPAEPANSCAFCSKAACAFCVALRLGYPSCVFQLGYTLQHLSKLVASVGRQEYKVMICFLIIFQPPHPRPFAIW